MDATDLQKIIDQFDEMALEPNASIGIYRMDDPSENYCIKASPEGLELLALQFLKASQEMMDSKSNNITLELNPEWFDSQSHIHLAFVERHTNPMEQILPRKQTIVDRLVPIGCGIVLIILAASLFIGLASILSWIF